MLEQRAVSFLVVGLFSFADGGEDESAPGPSARSGEHPDSERTHVLVVDDEPDAVDSIVELLETEGFAAIGARNGQEALALLEGGLRPGLILLDLKMPVMNGWDFCDALARDLRLADIPIAIVTASASLHALPVRRNDAGFFRKPLNFDQLLRRVRETCG